MHLAKLRALFALLRMKRLFLKNRVDAALNVARKKGVRFAWRHARLCRNVYEPWLRRKLQEPGLFDREYYISRYVKGELIVDPFEHYVRRGIYYDLFPNSHFDPVSYRMARMPLHSRLFPILHYAIHRSGDSGPAMRVPVNISSEAVEDIRLWEFQFLCREYRLDIGPQSRVLDFGCGNGKTVAKMRSMGWDWHGYDIVPRLSENARQYEEYFKFAGCVDEGANRANVTNYRLKEKAYRLPFDGGAFDLVISHQVMEHVFNLEETHRELMRILKPGGAAIHIYPPKECFWERHYNIPLGHRLHYRWYCNLWALAGFCGNHLKDTPWKERGRRGFEYNSIATNYTTMKQMRQIAGRYFSDVRIEPYPPTLSSNVPRELWRRFFPVDTILICRKEHSYDG